jgi:hypothetical protein
MIDATDINTVRAIRELFDGVRERTKEIVFWIGAGASAWCEYPRWPELAEHFHSQYARYEPRYDTSMGLELISHQSFPDLFQLCRDANVGRFYSLLDASFPPRQPTAVYHRFAAALRAISPCYVLTTNIDELLEKQLPAASTVTHRDLQRIERLRSSKQSFVCKLHGSISDLRSTVFTTEDYTSLLASVTFAELLPRLLGETTVVFVGYSLQDNYVVSMLAKNCKVAELFGDGPHFAIMTHENAALPPSIRVIKYIPEPHKDHRSSIAVVEEIRALWSSEPEANRVVEPVDKPAAQIRSAHLLFDIFPPGTWESSHTLGITDAAGAKRQMIVGTGFTNEEFPDIRSTAMHDLIVGLLCFDHVYTSISSVGRAHALLGAERFWRLVQEGVLSFVNWTQQEGIIFPSTGSVSGGDLCSFAHFNSDQTKRTVAQIVRKQLTSAPGKEGVAERLFTRLEASTQEITPAEEGGIPNAVRSLLLRPSIREHLGMSAGVPLGSLPRWNVFPVLRLANTVKIGAACRVLRISSAKLDFGTATLAGPSFAAATGLDWADDTAGYVLSGQFAADLGAVALQDPSLLDLILGFRETSAGEELRREISARLSASEGAEVNVAINSGLRSAVPSAALQKARDAFVNLLTPQQVLAKPPPAIWNDRRCANDALVFWRKRSLQILRQYCGQISIGDYDPCPCGSGEKLKFCCREALGST